MTATIILSILVVLLMITCLWLKINLNEKSVEYEELLESKNPSEIDAEVWQIEKTPGGFTPMVYNHKQPYECFIEMTKEQLIETLKERL